MNEIHGKRLASFGFFLFINVIHHMLFAYKNTVDIKFATNMMQMCICLRKWHFERSRNRAIFSSFPPSLENEKHSLRISSLKFWDVVIKICCY